MMKKKLRTEDLKVQSFVTNLKGSKALTIRAGVPPYSDDMECEDTKDSDPEETFNGTCEGSICDMFP